MTMPGSGQGPKAWGGTVRGQELSEVSHPVPHEVGQERIPQVWLQVPLITGCHRSVGSGRLAGLNPPCHTVPWLPSVPWPPHLKERWAVSIGSRPREPGRGTAHPLCRGPRCQNLGWLENVCFSLSSWKPVETMENDVATNIPGEAGHPAAAA